MQVICNCLCDYTCQVEFFCNQLSFATCLRWLQGLESHVSIKVKILSFATKIVVIYFQISASVSNITTFYPMCIGHSKIPINYLMKISFFQFQDNLFPFYFMLFFLSPQLLENLSSKFKREIPLASMHNTHILVCTYNFFPFPSIAR